MTSKQSTAHTHDPIRFSFLHLGCWTCIEQEQDCDYSHMAHFGGSAENYRFWVISVSLQLWTSVCKLLAQLIMLLTRVWRLFSIGHWMSHSPMWYSKRQYWKSIDHEQARRKTSRTSKLPDFGSWHNFVHYPDSQNGIALKFLQLFQNRYQSSSFVQEIMTMFQNEKISLNFKQLLTFESHE